MRLSVIATVSALALLGAPAFAQTTSSPGMPGGHPSGGSATTSTQHAADPLKQEDVSQIKGASVYGSDRQKIGTITTVLMDPNSKQINRLVVNAGGVLGVGGHDVALPVNQFRWDQNKDGFMIAKTGNELKSMPQWQREGAAGSGSSTAHPTSPSSSGAQPTPTPSKNH
jgi:sporulation protein YlmC with PRC-barrel domain